MSSKYTNFYSSGELWNRVPDDIYKKNKEENVEETFYIFLDVEANTVSMLCSEDNFLFSILPI